MSGYVLSNARSAPVVPAIASIVASDENDDVDDINLSIGRGGVFAYRTRRSLKKVDFGFWLQSATVASL